MIDDIIKFKLCINLLSEGTIQKIIKVNCLCKSKEKSIWHLLDHCNTFYWHTFTLKKNQESLSYRIINSIILCRFNLKARYIIVLDMVYQYRIRRCQVPPLSSPPVKLEESWSYKNFSTNFFCKTYAFELYVN